MAYAKYTPVVRWDQTWAVPTPLAKLTEQIAAITQQQANAAARAAGTDASKLAASPSEDSAVAAAALQSLVGSTSVNEGPTVATTMPHNYLLKPFKIQKWASSERAPLDFSHDDVFINELIRQQRSAAGDASDAEAADGAADAAADGSGDAAALGSEPAADGDSAAPAAGQDSMATTGPDGPAAGGKRKEPHSPNLPAHSRPAVGAPAGSLPPAKKLKADAEPAQAAGAAAPASTDGDDADEEIRIDDELEGNDVEGLQIQEIGQIAPRGAGGDDEDDDDDDEDEDEDEDDEHQDDDDDNDQTNDHDDDSDGNTDDQDHE